MNKIGKIADKFININGEIILKDKIVADLTKIKNKNISDIVYTAISDIEYRICYWQIEENSYAIFKCLAEDIGMGILKYTDTKNTYIMFPDTTIVRYNNECSETETYVNILEFLCYVFQMEYSDMYKEIDE